MAQKAARHQSAGARRVVNDAPPPDHHQDRDVDRRDLIVGCGSAGRRQLRLEVTIPAATSAATRTLAPGGRRPPAIVASIRSARQPLGTEPARRRASAPRPSTWHPASGRRPCRFACMNAYAVVGPTNRTALRLQRLGHRRRLRVSAAPGVARPDGPGRRRDDHSSSASHAGHLGAARAMSNRRDCTDRPGSPMPVDRVNAGDVAARRSAGHSELDPSNGCRGASTAGRMVSQGRPADRSPKRSSARECVAEARSARPETSAGVGSSAIARSYAARYRCQADASRK